MDDTAGGGFPGWLTNSPAKARTNETGFTDAWMPYITSVAEFIEPYQVRVSIIFSPVSSDSLTGMISSTPMAPSSPCNPRMSSSNQRPPTPVARSTCSSSRTPSAQTVSRRFLSCITMRRQKGRSLVVLVWSICMSGIRIRMVSTAAILLSGPISIRH